MNAHARQIHAENTARIKREREQFAEKLGLKPRPPADIDAAFLELLERESGK